MKDHTDEQLMALVQQEKPAYLEFLFVRYQKQLYNYFLKCTLDHEAGQDLTQMTFIRIMNYRHSFRTDRGFRVWLFQIARNLVKDHFRQREPGQEQLDPAAQLYGQPGEGETGERMEREARLHKALGLLPPDKRELLVMSKFQGMKYKDIAKIRDTSVGAVKVQVYRAIAQLRQIYFEVLDE